MKIFLFSYSKLNEDCVNVSGALKDIVIDTRVHSTVLFHIFSEGDAYQMKTGFGYRAGALVIHMEWGENLSSVNNDCICTNILHETLWEQSYL